MTPIRLLAAAALTAVLAGPALAQDPAPIPEDAANPPASTSMPTDTPAPAATDMGAPASATAPMIMRQDSVSPEQAATLKAGDPNVVTNGPIPDTRENRRKYGGPMSTGGRRTTPAGN